MNAEEIKAKLRSILGEQITFNKNFEEYAENIKNIDFTLIEWFDQVKAGEVKPSMPSRLKDSIVFIRKIGSSNRCIVIKIKNGIFTEVHLGDHRYYDDIRKKLGLKESSNY